MLNLSRFQSWAAEANALGDLELQAEAEWAVVKMLLALARLDEAVDLALERLKAQNPDEYETRKSGALMASEGLIFKNWNRRLHVKPGAEIEAVVKSRRITRHRCGVDFGRTVPHCTLWGARDESGRWYIYAEHHRAEWTIERHAEAMRTINEQWGIEPSLHYCDPGDGSKTELGKEVVTSGRSHLRKQGFNIANADKRWSEGCRTIQRLLAPEIVMGDDGPVSGEPMLYISDECPNLIREIGMYRRLAGTAISDREGPVKKDDHAVDALRYLLHTDETRYAGGGGGVSGGGARRGAADPLSVLRG